MGNSASSHPKNPKVRSKHQGSSRTLEEQDLDHIYNFVKDLKTTDDGADLLEMFLERQSTNVEGLEGALYEAKKQEPVPIQSIVISHAATRPSVRTMHRPTVSPSA